METLVRSGLKVDSNSGRVCFPRKALEELLARAPRTFTLGARNPERALPLPRPDGTFYARTCTGGHGWIDPETAELEKVTLARLADWARLVNHLDEISFMPYLFPDDAPVATADIHALATLFKHTDKHLWVQPYCAESVAALIDLAAAAAGGRKALSDNPLISMIACSLTPRAFKQMDMEVILQAARAGIPIHACSLPGAGGTAPATVLGTVLLAVAEILAMVAMAQAVQPGAPVVACPIIFSTDMATGRSLQASVEAMRGASLADQFLKQEFGLPTHNYGSGTDSPIPDMQSMSERAMLTTWMAASGLDILGGAGQLEVATVVSPLQLIVDNEVLAMARRLVMPFSLDDDQMGWQPLTSVEPGMHFMLADHTLEHCRDAFVPHNFTRPTRDDYEKSGRKNLMDRVMEDYRVLMAKENSAAAPAELCAELDQLVAAADSKLSSG
jgi:trimethylamine:corrinoid methyltransferase-like protein